MKLFCAKKITVKHRNWILWEEVFEFDVPIDTTKSRQIHAPVRRNDRRLPVGHRFRGDVGVI